MDKLKLSKLQSFQYLYQVLPIISNFNFKL
jgi:hypothetical protein